MATKPSAKKVEAPKAPLTPREILLREAISITTKDRDSAYGNPEDNFANIAAYWSRYLSDSAKLEITLSAQDVAHMMVLMKIARLSTNPMHYDSLVDVAGYAACAADCVAADQHTNRPVLQPAEAAYSKSLDPHCR